MKRRIYVQMLGGMLLGTLYDTLDNVLAELNKEYICIEREMEVPSNHVTVILYSKR